MKTSRRVISIDSKLADELRNFALKKHGFLNGSVRAEACAAIKAHIAKGKAEEVTGKQGGDAHG